jgi:hypothetical protein
MKVGIIQSNYIPWKGYFDFIDDVDLFVLFDDVQYTNRDWRNRNKIKTREGMSWLTVPVKNRHAVQTIQETEIDYSEPWQENHLNKIKENYLKAPHYGTFIQNFFDLISKKYGSISELNISLIKWLMKELNINTPLIMSSELNPVGNKTDRLIDILKKVNANMYLSGPAASGYLEVEKFKKEGIGLEYKSYSYTEYGQLFGVFEHGVTILDLIFNCGSDVRMYFKSLEPNKEVFVPNKSEIIL